MLVAWFLGAGAKAVALLQIEKWNWRQRRFGEDGS